MTDLLQLVEDEQTSEFYPTPPELVCKMLEGINWNYITTILEPSAGKGDILKHIATYDRRKHYEKPFDIDCIEIDPHLRQILKYNFSDDREQEISARISEIENSRIYDKQNRKYIPCTNQQQAELNELEQRKKQLFSNGIHIIHDNFLTYQPYKQYDIIIMNPPFSNGDKHLLKALDMQRNGGSIVCLLNAETLRNPCTETRRELMHKLTDYNAKIEYISGAFKQAERKTGVEVAMIKVHIEKVHEESEIYKRFEKAEKVKDFNPKTKELAVSDYLEAIVHQYNAEVKSGLELIRQYKAMIPYMSREFVKDKAPILRLTDSNDRCYESVKVNDYLEKVRLKYWKALLQNPKFIGKLTSELKEKYYEQVGRLADYDFSMFNIMTLSAEINLQVKQGIEDEIVKMFDRLTEEHTWYPECMNNRHLYNGWKTNQAHKIGKKVIIPCCQVFDNYSGKPGVYCALNVLGDLERILNFLDGNMTQDVDMLKQLQDSFAEGITRNIPLKYFSATFYKKGTVHLVFNCPELIDRFNIYVAQQKNWLPPSYGKKAYSNMTAAEKEVVDSFQGESAYQKVLEKSQFYLAPVTNGKMLMLSE